MAQRKSTAGMIDRFAYTPGDGHRYAWRGSVIVVERIRRVDPEGLDFRPTGDVIPCPEIQTATAFMAAVDQWRAGRVTGEG